MKTIIKKQVLGYDHAVISEDAENYYVDLKTGFGEGIYPKTGNRKSARSRSRMNPQDLLNWVELSNPKLPN
jgi:hypothetical protein